MRRYEQIVGGIYMMAVLAEIFTHPEGTRRMSDTVTWAIVYYPDWDHYASRFTD